MNGSSSAFLKAATVGLVVLAVATTVAVVTTPDADAIAATRSASVTPESVIAVAEVPAPVAATPPAADDAKAADGGPSLPPVAAPLGSLGIPATVLAAYHRAAEATANRFPACGLSWSLIAGIGKVESGHASAGAVDSTTGDTNGQIRGRVLNGTGAAAIPDTDAGRLDGDAQWDRAIGPMQFIPTTWAAYATDGNGDDVASPDNVFDATAAAGRFLCSRGPDLTTRDGRTAALLRYNRSQAYGVLVQRWADAYLQGASEIPDRGAPAVLPVPDVRAGAVGGSAVDAFEPTPDEGGGAPVVAAPPEAQSAASAVSTAVASPTATGPSTSVTATPTSTTSPEPTTLPTVPPVQDGSTVTAQPTTTSASVVRPSCGAHAIPAPPSRDAAVPGKGAASVLEPSAAPSSTSVPATCAER